MANDTAGNEVVYGKVSKVCLGTCAREDAQHLDNIESRLKANNLPQIGRDQGRGR